jgi:uncharacterized protein YecE (DUF72 family)
MDFGKVPEAELDTIDFSLPGDPESNRLVLKGKPAAHPRVYMGCAKWGRKEWIGKIYPKGTKEKDFLKEYVHHFNSIELNATHYKVYDAATVSRWRSAAGQGSDFKFCPKMYKGVTHFGRLDDKEPLTTAFLEGILAFGEMLGPVFVQVSDAFSPRRQEELFRYLKSLPTDLSFFVEVRNQEWFADPAASEALFGMLRSLKMGAVITDAAGRRDCAHMRVTVPATFVRFVGNSLHPSDYTRIDDWVKRIKQWLSHGLKELYFFMHMHDEATSPELSQYLAEQLNKHCGLALRMPLFLPVQKNLFG